MGTRGTLNKDMVKKIIEISTEIQAIARIQYLGEGMNIDDYQGCIEGQLLKLVHIVTEKVKEKYGIEKG